MLTPAYKLTLGRQAVDSTREPRASTLVDLTVALDLDTPADGFTLALGNVGSLAAARGDAVAIDLGYADDGGFERVMAGTVTAVDANLTTTRVTGVSGASALLALFVEQTFESKTAGAITRDLAGRAAVEVARAEDGILFPSYVVDGRRSAWHHLGDLAELCGFDLYVGPDGKLVCERFAGGRTAHVFELGKHVLSLDVLRTPPLAGRVEAWGESPTASAGDDAWPWLTSDFSGSRGAAAATGADGSGPLLLLERPALRTRAAASTAAGAALTAIARRTLRGRLVVLGRPQVHLGDAIHLRGHADAALNAVFQVRSVTHRLNKAAGFTTAVGFRSLAVAGASA